MHELQAGVHGLAVEPPVGCDRLTVTSPAGPVLGDAVGPEVGQGGCRRRRHGPGGLGHLRPEALGDLVENARGPWALADQPRHAPEVQDDHVHGRDHPGGETFGLGSGVVYTRHVPLEEGDEGKAGEAEGEVVGTARPEEVDGLLEDAETGADLVPRHSRPHRRHQRRCHGALLVPASPGEVRERGVENGPRPERPLAVE